MKFEEFGRNFSPCFRNVGVENGEILHYIYATSITAGQVKLISQGVGVLAPLPLALLVKRGSK